MSFYEPSGFVPDSSLGYLSRRIKQLTEIGLEPVFALEGLTGTQWSALISIHFGRGGTCADLARDLSHDKGATTRLVDVLEARGWVTRDRDAGRDRRITRLALTDEGRRVAHHCREHIAGCWNVWLEDWSDKDVAAAIAMMQRLRDTLETAVIEEQRA